jgi:hypothetical protein
VYYANLDFPQENFFTQVKGGVVMVFWRVMWLLALISIFVGFSYIFMALLWFVIGAIISPNAYLPFASGAVAFLTVI